MNTPTTKERVRCPAGNRNMIHSAPKIEVLRQTGPGDEAAQIITWRCRVCGHAEQEEF